MLNKGSASLLKHQVSGLEIIKALRGVKAERDVWVLGFVNRSVRAAQSVQGPLVLQYSWKRERSGKNGGQAGRCSSARALLPRPRVYPPPTARGAGEGLEQ